MVHVLIKGRFPEAARARYLKADGEKDVIMRSLIWAYRKYHRTIREHLALLEKMLTHYESTAKPGKKG